MVSLLLKIRIWKFLLEINTTKLFSFHYCPFSWYCYHWWLTGKDELQLFMDSQADIPKCVHFNFSSYRFKRILAQHLL